MRAVQWAVKSAGSQGHRIGQPRHALRPLNLTLDGHGWYRPCSAYEYSENEEPGVGWAA
jgi:hypothetical protein